MRNLYTGLEAIIQTEHGKTDLSPNWQLSETLIYAPQSKICGLTWTDGKKMG